MLVTIGRMKMHSRRAFKLINSLTFISVIKMSEILTIHLPQVLREGNRGFGILVSSMPKESNAFYSLRDPSEVLLVVS